jgi:hypothetical protein
MRRILVENPRHKRSQRAGGDCQRVELSDVNVALPQPWVDVLALRQLLVQGRRHSRLHFDAAIDLVEVSTPRAVVADFNRLVEVAKRDPATASIISSA